MLDKNYFQLLGAIVTGGLIGWFTNFLSVRRERAAFKRQDLKDLHRETARAYVRALMVIDRGIHSKNIGAREDQEAVFRWRAELALLAPEDIQQQFSNVGVVLDQWSAAARASGPEQRDGLLIFKPVVQEKHQIVAEEVWPKVEASRQKLEKMMREHLESLQPGT